MTNLFPQSGLELDFTNWFAYPDSVISTVDPQAGTKCVLITTTIVAGESIIVAPKK